MDTIKKAGKVLSMSRALMTSIITTYINEGSPDELIKNDLKRTFCDYDIFNCLVNPSYDNKKLRQDLYMYLSNNALFDNWVVRHIASIRKSIFVNKYAESRKLINSPSYPIRMEPSNKANEPHKIKISILKSRTAAKPPKPIVSKSIHDPFEEKNESEATLRMKIIDLIIEGATNKDIIAILDCHGYLSKDNRPAILDHFWRADDKISYATPDDEFILWLEKKLCDIREDAKFVLPLFKHVHKYDIIKDREAGLKSAVNNSNKVFRMTQGINELITFLKEKMEFPSEKETHLIRDIILKMHELGLYER